MLNIECPIARQSSITIFLRHPVQYDPRPSIFIENREIKQVCKCDTLGVTVENKQIKQVYKCEKRMGPKSFTNLFLNKSKKTRHIK